MTNEQFDVTQEDVDAFTSSLRRKGTPFSEGCASLIDKLWAEVKRRSATEPGHNCPRCHARCYCRGEHDGLPFKDCVHCEPRATRYHENCRTCICKDPELVSKQGPVMLNDAAALRAAGFGNPDCNCVGCVALRDAEKSRGGVSHRSHCAIFSGGAFCDCGARPQVKSKAEPESPRPCNFDYYSDGSDR